MQINVKDLGLDDYIFIFFRQIRNEDAALMQYLESKVPVWEKYTQTEREMYLKGVFDGLKLHYVIYGHLVNNEEVLKK